MVYFSSRETPDWRACWPRSAGKSKTTAAAALGMKPSTFRDKLAKHGL